MNKSKNVTIVISAKELRGITLFLLLLVMVIVFPLFLNIRTEDRKSTVEFLGEKGAVLKDFSSTERSKEVDREDYNGSPIYIESASFQELESIGIPATTAKTLVKFREKGKVFNSKEDLKSVYGMTDDLIDRVSRHIIFKRERDNVYVASTEYSKYRKDYQYYSNYQSPHKPYNIYKEESYKIPSSEQALKPVNPQSTDQNEWVSAGIPKKLASTIVKFLSKGGIIEKPGDLMKIYGMDSTIYKTVLPQIKFPESQQQFLSPEINAEELIEDVIIESVNLNNSTVDQWRRLPGVGSSYAYRIVNFREKIGGFHNPEQIKEVYGLPDSLFSKIREYIISDEFQPNLRINNLSREELAAHPFIDFKTAGLIITFRRQHGDFKDFRDLQKMFGIDKTTLDKLKPYLIYH